MLDRFIKSHPGWLYWTFCVTYKKKLFLLHVFFPAHIWAIKSLYFSNLHPPHCALLQDAQWSCPLTTWMRLICWVTGWPSSLRAVSTAVAHPSSSKTASGLASTSLLCVGWNTRLQRWGNMESLCQENSSCVLESVSSSLVNLHNCPPSTPAQPLFPRTDV